jgi:glycosyltransferase involved in cell wall biosynthesis
MNAPKNTLEGRNIICFAPTDWWSMNPSCTTHIMKRLSCKNKVLYINPFSSDFLGASKTKIARRFIRKFKSIVKFLRRVHKNLYVFSPIFLPFQGERTIDALNNFLLKLQIKTVCSVLGMSKPLLWIENLRAADLLELFQPLATIYHVSDLFVEDEYVANQKVLHEREKKISDASDILICVSRRLYEAKACRRGNVFYIPHGVDFELFSQAANNDKNIEELAHIPRPIAGYYGTLTASNDIELLQYCAVNLRNVSFVFAGQITGGNYEELAKLPNVYFIGKLPYEKIPPLCASFDVCLLQWKMDKWIKFCNPLKFFEYMASGNPIVSVPIDEVADKYSDLVSVAKTKEEYCDAIKRELQNDTLQRSRRRIEIAKEHSWDNQVEKISGLIMDIINSKQNKNSCITAGQKEIVA